MFQTQTATTPAPPQPHPKKSGFALICFHGREKRLITHLKLNAWKTKAASHHGRRRRGGKSGSSRRKYLRDKNTCTRTESETSQTSLRLAESSRTYALHNEILFWLTRVTSPLNSTARVGKTSTYFNHVARVLLHVSITLEEKEETLWPGTRDQIERGFSVGQGSKVNRELRCCGIAGVEHIICVSTPV